MSTNGTLPALLIRGGRILDPAHGIDTTGDLLIEGGRIASVGGAVEQAPDRVIDATGLVVCPGFVDLHTHLREPGFEHKETIETGTLAAARGGFTTVCAMPNTEPAADTRSVVEFVLRRAAEDGHVRVLPIGAVSKGRAGKELAEIAELAAAGVVALSDDGSPVADPGLMRRALEYAAAYDLPVSNHCETPELVAGGSMHEGWVSTRLGLRGRPAAAEESMVARDIGLAELTGARVHIAHVSTAGAVEAIRRARERGVAVTAEVTPHHLTLTHEAVAWEPDPSRTGRTAGLLQYDTNAKVNPPLRTRTDVEACVAGLRDGVIDAVATDHAPHALVDKQVEFDLAAPGISNLETALAQVLSLVHAGALDLPTAVARLTAGPARAWGLDRRLPGIGTLAAGAPADVTVFDPEAEWTVEPQAFASRGKNTPLAGQRLKGRVVATLTGGRPVHGGERVGT